MKPTEITINYKRSDKITHMKKVVTSQEAAAIFKDVWSDQIEYREEIYLLLLNRPNQILGWLKLSQGGTAGTIVDIKMIYQAALKSNAHGIILCHNHPSGNLKPSREDLQLTKTVNEAGKLLDIKLLDHLIITAEGYYSFADEGLL